LGGRGGIIALLRLLNSLESFALVIRDKDPKGGFNFPAAMILSGGFTNVIVLGII